MTLLSKFLLQATAFTNMILNTWLKACVQNDEAFTSGSASCRVYEYHFRSLCFKSLAQNDIAFKICAASSRVHKYYLKKIC